MKPVVDHLGRQRSCWHIARIATLAAVAVVVSGFCVTSSAADTAAETLRIAVKGRNLVDAKGNVVQLRGANLSGLEFVAVQGWSAGDPWGGQYHSNTFDLMLKWNMNVVRIPLNEASWLGYPCVNGAKVVKNPDPGRNYQDTVKKTIDKATAKGLYVIIDLHMTAPDDPLQSSGAVKAVCPMQQNPMPSLDHSVDFWTSVANTFKSYPNVIFELFNEPYFDWKYVAKNDWEILRDGGIFRAYRTDSIFVDGHAWKAAGMQQLVDAVRKTGATNIVLVSGPNWAQRLDEWLKFKPEDPLKQLGAAWHAYPAFGKKWGTDEYNFPGLGADAYKWAENILNANIPLLITEIGDRSAPGTKGAPFVSRVLPWADRNGVSYLGWTFNVWPHESAVLLKSASGDPTDGFGEYFKAHLACRAAGKTPCP